MKIEYALTADSGFLESPDNPVAAVLPGQIQRGAAGEIGQGRFGTRRQQGFHRELAARASGAHQRGFTLLVGVIDGRTGIQQGAEDIIMVVHGAVYQGGIILIVN